MFRRDVKEIKELIMRNLREQGLEMPLLQKRLVDAWPEVAGLSVGQYTLNSYIMNQTLYVHLSVPSLRADLNMKRQELVKRLNDYVGSPVITDIKFR